MVPARVGKASRDGGGVLAAYETRRSTNEIDFQVGASANDADTVLGLVREISTVERDDGLILDVADAIAEVIRDGHEYSGVHVVVARHVAGPLSRCLLRRRCA